MTNDLDLNLLKVFVAVYRHQSITLAAEEMSLTQPGVSGLLKRLQNQTGCQLFVRSGRGIAPTQHAEQLIRQVEPALNQINNALESLNGFSTDHPRRFVVFTSEPMMLLLLPKVEADSTLGKVTIELQPTHTSEEQLFHGLSQHKADLAIEFSNYSTPSFFTEDLLQDDICIIARNGHPRVSRRITKEQYYQEKHITLKLRREDAYLADYFTEESLSGRKVAAECTSLLSQMSMVSTSDCVAFTSRSIANLFADKLDIQVLEAPFQITPVKHRILAHNRERKSPSNVWLRNKLKAYFRDE